MSNKTIQSDIAVENGDVVGGNKYSPTYVFAGPVSPITHLSIEYEKEIGRSSPGVSQFLPELKHYMSAVTSSQVQGLEQKLLNANRNGQMVDASRQKELFAKQLHKHATSQAAQRIFLYLLGELLQRFRVYAKPIIEEEAPTCEIDRIVFEKVISPALQSLDRNVLDLYHDEIWGMVYYLTGNCHIRWSKEC
ncbi:MAG: ABC-three component system protein [Pseudomonadota bacterium]